MANAANRVRSARLEVRMSPADRRLIDEAVAVSGTALTDFVLASLRVSAHDALADRTTFALDDDARRVWDEMNDRPVRELAGLEALLLRPSPFVDE